MTVSLISKVFNFLWVTVWGKINIWQFLMLNKHYFILVGSNIILSLLFIYMAEQTTVRTDQYRKLQEEITAHAAQVVTLRNEIETLDKRNKNLIESFAVSKVEVKPEEILNDYNKWAAELRAIEQDIESATQRLGATHERRPTTPTDTDRND